MRHTRTIIKVYSETYATASLHPERRLVTSSRVRRQRADPEKKPWPIGARTDGASTTAHQILDCAFEEDKHPWITKDANGALVIMLMRRLVYTMMTLYKSVTIRSEEARETMTWRELMKQIRDTVEWARQSVFEGLRQRAFAIPPALA